jgi:hypothetical protein
MSLLDQEEYVEQSHFFRALRERMPASMPLQELLEQIQEELLTTTKLPLAVGFLLSELRHTGVFGTAMAQLPHYFAPFQTYLVQEAEDERGRFDMRIALEVLRFEAEYRAKAGSRQGLFLYQFETLCRNRLRYERGLAAMAEDPMYDQPWSEWILTVRRQIGLVDFADLVYVRSEHYRERHAIRGEAAKTQPPVLFGVKEGKIARASRRKDPLYLFAAMQRHLGYPPVPRPKPPDELPNLVPQMLRRLERLETRIKLLEDEQRGGIDLEQFYTRPEPPKP